MSTVLIPTWEEAKQHVDSGRASTLDLYVYHNEPAGEKDDEWRQQLQDLVDWLLEEKAGG